MVTPPTIRAAKLNTPEKREHMTEAHVAAFRDGIRARARGWGLADVMVDVGRLTADPESDKVSLPATQSKQNSVVFRSEAV